MRKLLLAAFLSLISFSIAGAQAALPERIPSDDALDRVLKNNVLTSGGPPFHAILDIGMDKKNDPAFQGRVEVFWQDARAYRLSVKSPEFSQTLIVNGDKVEESDQGDFYPSWLHSFVSALIDPMPRISSLRGRNETVPVGPNLTFSCLRREDKVNGVGNILTWAEICFDGDVPRLAFVMDFTYDMAFKDFQRFGDKQIARTYLNGTGDNPQLRGTLTTLEPWQPDPSMITVAKATAPQNRISTTPVSTLTEESMVESAPKKIAWPTVREGKLDGYMIIRAITDRTGQVREAWKHNADNRGMQDVGLEAALKYKFRPLIVDGVAQQMEMPLVIHFTTRIENPIPELDDKTSRKMITGCSLPTVIQDPASAGQYITIQIQVAEDGNLMTLGSSDRKIPVPVLYQQFRGCHYTRYKQNGVLTAYHLNLSVLAK